MCVNAGRCGAAPPVFRLLDGLIYISFLSHFSVCIMRNDVYIVFLSHGAPAWTPSRLDHARSPLAKRCIKSKN
jgi:hypothetical protein